MEAITAQLDGLLLNPGAVAVAVAIGVVFLRAAWKAAEKIIETGVGKLVEKQPALVLLYLVPLMACLMLGRWYTAGTILIVALAMALLIRGKRVRRIAWWAVAVQLGVFVAGAGLERAYVEHRQRQMNEMLQVYVVLPFEPFKAASESQIPEEQGRLRLLSSGFTLTLNEIFAEAVPIHMFPRSFEELVSMELWRDVDRARAELSRQRLDPDMTLENQINQLDDSIRFVTTVWIEKGSNDKFGMDRRKSIVCIGRADDEPLLLLQLASEVMQMAIAQLQNPIDEEARFRIKRNIVTEFCQLSVLSPEHDSAACRQILDGTGDKAKTLWEEVRKTDLEDLIAICDDSRSASASQERREAMLLKNGLG